MNRGLDAAEAPPISVGQLTNNQIIIRLTYTVDHLSRWLSPVHDDARLTRSAQRSEPSAKDLMIRMRDEGLRVFPMIYAMATQDRPDLDLLPPVVRTEEDLAWDRQAVVLEIMSEFRRLRQSTTSVLRSLPDDAWKRDGLSRIEHDWTIRSLAEHLLLHDVRLLGEMDHALERAGARAGIARLSQARLTELLRLAP
ncbi:MAG: hypothetical protein IT337_11970 [Thermomicrobiales bacterium]|nr:hypothetical protein [Thermomicrobiales bacterium]